MDITWACEMAVLWDGNYWDMTTIYVDAPEDIGYAELNGIASDELWEDDVYDDALGAYLYNHWRMKDYV